MLILCYGMVKSGSTLAFELVKGMLASAGHAQDRLSGGVVLKKRRINFRNRIDAKSVDRILAAIPDGRAIAVKTHAGIDRDTFLHLEALQAARKLQVIVSYRDPRDIALSLADAGARARDRGASTWAEAKDLQSAMTMAARQIAKFKTWATLRGALLLEYSTVAFEPERAMDAIETALGITADRAAARRHAFEQAFTQKAKAVPDRHKTELTPEQDAEMQARFGDFIDNVIVKSDPEWLARTRAEFLTHEPKRAHVVKKEHTI